MLCADFGRKRSEKQAGRGYFRIFSIIFLERTLSGPKIAVMVKKHLNGTDLLFPGRGKLSGNGLPSGTVPGKESLRKDQGAGTVQDPAISSG